MTEMSPHDDCDHTAPPSEMTHRFDTTASASPPPRQFSGASRRFGTGIATISLVLGVLGGVAGAAGFAAVDDRVDDPAPGSSSSEEESRTSAVSTSPDSPAEDGSVEQVAGSVLRSVVKINVSGSQGTGSGSGIVLSRDGLILTNNHVVAVAEEGGRIAVNFADGSSAPAEVVGTDPLTDLAVISAEGVSGLTPATIGQSGQLDVGENVVAIGSPFGLEATVTSGIVSALQRPVSAGDSSQQTASATTYPAIQTDAAINPGNSGGPLVNMRGEVVGINSSIRTASSGVGSEGGSIGLGFAIPIDNVLPIVEQLRSDETPTHARLGVSVADEASTDGLVSGARVESVEAGSAAEAAGLAEGDVITRIDDQLTTDSESLVATIRGRRPGDDVTLTVVPGGADGAETIEATLDSDKGVASS